jgi:magnesium-protoporphyrin O-methyltransferase
MADCDCASHSNVFSERMAEADLRSYLEKGPDRPTRELLDAIRNEGVTGATVLDIGGGVGAVQLELLTAGAARTESVDASPAFAAVARREAERRGLGDRTVHRQGDFVTLAPEVSPADVVTLVRAVCCYPAMPALLAQSVEHARRMIGIVYPRDAWWTRIGAWLVNVGYHVARDSFRIHVHSEAAMDRLVRDAGFERRVLRRGPLWQVALYVRPAGPTGEA